MGSWGIGLYSSDFAQDLRGSVKAVARLPFSPAELLDLLREGEPGAANDTGDPDHSIFWLVVADQFARRGIDCPAARERALTIIADGADLAAMRALGMDEKSLRKRQAALEALRTEIAVVASKPRATLKKPQKLLLTAGDAVAYPICEGKPINPYAVGKEYAWVKAWKQDGWGAFVVAECGLMYGYLAWYRPLVIAEPLTDRPDLAELQEPHMWILQNPGTLSARHYQNMQVQPVGRLPIDFDKVSRAFPKRLSPRSSVVSDISIANQLTVRRLDPDKSYAVRRGHPPRPRIAVLAEILSTG